MISRDANKMIILCVLQLITDKWQMLKFYTILSKWSKKH